MFFPRLNNLIFRRALSKVADPLVRYKIGRFTMKLPLSHELPFHQRLHEHYALNIVRIAQGVILKYPYLTLIDIGANVGDTVLLVRSSVSCPILGIEGDPRFSAIMKENCGHLNDVVLRCVFVGEKDEGITAKLSQVRGSANLVDQKGDRLVQVMKLGTILDRDQRFFGSKILKIDTDGFELKIIRGARDWITRTKPVIFLSMIPHVYNNRWKIPVRYSAS